jgi:hypothetical protein
MQCWRRLEGIAQLRRDGAQARGRECREGGRIGPPSASACSMRRALTPGKSDTRLIP